MTDHPDLMRRLRETLAKLYDNPGSASLVAYDIGLDTTRIERADRPIVFWHSIVREAERQDKVDELLARALSEYPRHADLAALAAEYRALRAAPVQAVAAKAVPLVARQPHKRAWLLSGLGLAAVAVVVGLVVRSLVGGTGTLLPTATRAAVAQLTATPEPQAAPPTTVLPVATTAPTPTETVAPSPTVTARPTRTRTPPPTATATSTATLTSTNTAAASPTATAEPTWTRSPTQTATPALQAGATVTGPNEMVLVYVPAGSFWMGSSDGDPYAGNGEKPQCQVNPEGFWITRTEVTNAQYLRCVSTGPCFPPQNTDYNRPELANRPVTGVTWYDAVTYAQWVGGRLPTEAEWEKACRGTDGRLYPWGSEAPTAELLNYANNVGHTTDVGSYPAGASPYGVFDMAGNVLEWTTSVDREYPYQADDGREGATTEGARVLRGGSYLFDQRDARCASRSGLGRNVYIGFVGFRVVVSLSSSGF